MCFHGVSWGRQMLGVPKSTSAKTSLGGTNTGKHICLFIDSIDPCFNTKARTQPNDEEAFQQNLVLNAKGTRDLVLNAVILGAHSRKSTKYAIACAPVATVPRQRHMQAIDIIRLIRITPRCALNTESNDLPTEARSSHGTDHEVHYSYSEGIPHLQVQWADFQTAMQAMTTNSHSIRWTPSISIERSSQTKQTKLRLKKKRAFTCVV
eukprot:4995396-Amphidinium_carterae.3